LVAKLIAPETSTSNAATVAIQTESLAIRRPGSLAEVDRAADREVRAETTGEETVGVIIGLRSERRFGASLAEYQTAPRPGPSRKKPSVVHWLIRANVGASPGHGITCRFS
jgi:hypothetical protein